MNYSNNCAWERFHEKTVTGNSFCTVELALPFDTTQGKGTSNLQRAHCISKADHLHAMQVVYQKKALTKQQL
tara:strand:- start:310 stop:525 length:216 start_codon:yes stop_codon:yes gene_type:complete